MPHTKRRDLSQVSDLQRAEVDLQQIHEPARWLQARKSPACHSTCGLAPELAGDLAGTIRHAQRHVRRRGVNANTPRHGNRRENSQTSFVPVPWARQDSRLPDAATSSRRAAATAAGQRSHGRTDSVPETLMDILRGNRLQPRRQSIANASGTHQRGRAHRSTNRPCPQTFVHQQLHADGAIIAAYAPRPKTIANDNRARASEGFKNRNRKPAHWSNKPDGDLRHSGRDSP